MPHLVDSPIKPKNKIHQENILAASASLQKVAWLGFFCEESQKTMDRDRELLKELKNSGTDFLLRFYKWKSPTLSYGRLQTLEPESRKKYESEDWNIVSRPTGGGKVFHKNDLCFSLFWKKENGQIPWKILDSYQSIHQWINQTLQELGITCDSAPSKKDNLKESWCFQNPVSHDLLRANKKIVGGAQWRDGNLALHQGSIQLNLTEPQLPTFKSNFEKIYKVTFS